MRSQGLPRWDWPLTIWEGVLLVCERLKMCRVPCCQPIVQGNPLVGIPFLPVLLPGINIVLQKQAIQPHCSSKEGEFGGPGLEQPRLSMITTGLGTDKSMYLGVFNDFKCCRVQCTECICSWVRPCRQPCFCTWIWRCSSNKTSGWWQSNKDYFNVSEEIFNGFCQGSVARYRHMFVPR